MDSTVDDLKVIGSSHVKSEVEKEQDRAAVEYGSTDSRLTMDVKIYSPFRDYYSGPAFSISALNATGPFDILPKHHNFISLLIACDLIIRTEKSGEQKIKISGGVIHVKANNVIVFLDV
jgi:F0F1-type ATP synthase epsilon subunit